MRTVIQSRFLLISSLGALALAGVVSACSSSNNRNSNDSGTEAGGSPSSSGSSSGVSEGGAEASTTGEGGACTTVNVYNFDDWCTVSVNYAATSVAATYSSCVTTGGFVYVNVAPASSTFELGPNPFVYGSNDPGTEVRFDGGSPSLLGLTADGPACILVCCPFTNGTGCDASESGYSAFLANCGQ